MPISVERPNLDTLDPAVRAYIEALEAEVEHLRLGRARPRPTEAVGEPPPLPDEPPTTWSVITVSAAGVAKRSFRHLYSRQRRGGMGVFDLDTPESDPPAFLVLADESQSLDLVTDQARIFRLPVRELPASPVRSRGQSILARLPLNPGERLALILPDDGEPYVALLTARGHVLWFAAHLFGEKLRPGTILYDAARLGPPSAACWSPSDADLFIATRLGYAIRFPARLVPVRGCLGIRLERDDTAIAIAAVREESGVFMLGADGSGAIRQMAGFKANKAPGAGGKIAMKTERLVGALPISGEPGDAACDIFAISRLGKIIRFSAAEVPPKEGPVQGVNCMSLRGDEVVALGAMVSRFRAGPRK